MDRSQSGAMEEQTEFIHRPSTVALYHMHHCKDQDTILVLRKLNLRHFHSATAEGIWKVWRSKPQWGSSLSP